MALLAGFRNALIPIQDVRRCRHEHTSRTMTAQAAPVGRYGDLRKKRSRAIRTKAERAPINGNGIPPQESPATPCTGHQRLPTGTGPSGSGCRFHRISAVVAKCEGCYSKEAQEVRYERLDPFRLAPRFRDVLGKLRHPRRRASGRVHPSVRRADDLSLIHI